MTHRTPDDIEKLTRDLEYRVREVETLNGHVRQLTAALETRGQEVEVLNRHVAELSRALATRGGEVETLARALNARVREAEGIEQAMAMTSGAPMPAPTEAAPTSAPGTAPARRIAPAPRLDTAGLVYTIIRTDLKVRYHGTLGGLLWALLKPLATLAVLVTVFGWLFAASPDYPLKLIIGIMLWEFFAEGTKVGLLSLAVKRHLVSKAVFPRWILVVTSLANAVVPLAVFSAALAVALAVEGRPLRLLPAAAFLWCLFQLALIVLGLSLGTSVLFVRYRDLNQIWEVAIQAGFFLAPIVYPFEIVPEPVRSWLQLWPPTAAIQYARMALLEQRVPSVEAHAVLAALAAVTLIVGTVLFRRHEPRLAEYV